MCKKTLFLLIVMAVFSVSCVLAESNPFNLSDAEIQLIRQKGFQVPVVEEDLNRLNASGILRPRTPGTVQSEKNRLVTAYVLRCYDMLLDRGPDDAGLEYWVNKLTDGSTLGAEIVRQFVNSREFASRGLSYADIVRILYQTMLGRSPDSAGTSYWVGLLETGVSVNYLVNGFATSAEFKEICSHYGITAGSITLTENRDQNVNVTGFVNRCYRYALNRNGDAYGLNYWCGMLLNHTATPQDMATQFIFSNEAIAQNWDNNTFVLRLYRLYMGREPDSAGLSYWVSLLNSGMDRPTVNASFAGSAEFRQICQNFGL